MKYVNFTPYAFTISDGDVRKIPGAAFVRVSSITSGLKINVRTTRGDNIPLGLSQKVSFPPDFVPNEIFLSNESGQSISINVLAGTGDLVDPELSGTVTVADDDNKVALDAGLYFGARDYIAATAAQSSYIHLLNPAGSGVTAYVTRCKVRNDTATNIHVKTYNGTALSLTTKGFFPFYNEGADPACEIRSGTNGTSYGTYVWSYDVPLNTFDDIVTGKDEIRIDEDSGLLISSSAANESIWADFRWREE